MKMECFLYIRLFQNWTKNVPKKHNEQEIALEYKWFLGEKFTSEIFSKNDSIICF